MQKFILKSQKSLLRFLTIYFSFNLILLFLGKYTPLVIDRYYSLNLITYSLLVIPFIYFFILIQKDKEYYKEKFEVYFKYGFLISLLLVTMGSLKFSFIENIRFLEVIVKFLSTQSLIITILAIGLGFFAFYFNREKIGQEIEKEQENEKIMEEKRKAEFASKFLKINKIPIIRKLLKWMYKEGWGYSVGIILIFLTGLFFRLWNLGKLSLWGDEGNVFIASKNIVETGLPYLETGFLYLRDIPHLYLTAASLKLFGYTELALRFPVSLLSSFLIIIIYLISRDLTSKKIGLASSLIIAIHPWIIEHSRIARSYGLVVFLLVASYYFFVKMLETNKKRYIFLFTVFGLLSVSTHQTGQIVFLLLIPLILGYLENTKYLFNKKNVLNLFNKILSFLIIFLGIILTKNIFSKGYYTASDQHIDNFQSIQQSGLLEKFISMIPLGTPKIDNLLFMLNPMPIIAITTIIFLFIFLLNYCKLRSNGKTLIIVTLIFLITLIFSKKDVTINRAILFLFPFFVLILSIGINKIIKLFIIHKKLFFLNFFIASLIIIYLFNLSSKIIFANYGDKISSYHSAFEGFIFRQDHKTTYEYINTRYQDGDVVLIYGAPQYSIMYAHFKPDYVIWSGTTLTFKGINMMTNILEINNSEKVEEIIINNQRVWILTSYSILSKTEMAPRVFHINNSLIKILEEFDDEIVYQSKDSSARVYFIEK